MLPYPLTFLCTDFISEFYGRRRANFVVWVGFLLNIIVIAFLWLGNALPGISESARPAWLPEGSWNPPPWQTLTLEAPTAMPFGAERSQAELLEMVYLCTRGSMIASMVAYLAAQFCDVYLFHFWKGLTRGKHLWLRNNGSTMVSQLIDATAVILVTFGAKWFAGEMAFLSIVVLIGSNYLYKVTVALLDTIPFYIGVKYLSRYLQIDPSQEHGAGAELSASP